MIAKRVSLVVVIHADIVFAAPAMEIRVSWESFRGFLCQTAMARHVIVLWDDNPISMRAIRAAGPIRVGAEMDADVLLPVDSCVIDSDGDTSVGPFVVRVSTSDETWARERVRLGDGVPYTLLSALLHAAVVASVAFGAHLSPSDPGADDASRLAAMKGYVARAADRGGDAPPSRIMRGAANLDVSDPVQASITAPPPAAPIEIPVAQASRARSPSLTTKPPTRSASLAQQTDTGSAGVGTSGARGKESGAAFRPGDDWTGTYVCPQGRTDLVVHVIGTQDQDVSAVFDFTHAPTGVHGAFRMHGRVNPVTGEASLTPDEWIERPPSYVSVGMSGRFAGKAFNGIITSEGCGGFSLHRRPGKV